MGESIDEFLVRRFENPYSFKNIFLSILYVGVIFLFLTLTSYGIDYLMNYVVLDVLNWFNHSNLFFKIILIMFGGYTLFLLFFSLAEIIARVTIGIILKFLPINLFTMWSSTILVFYFSGVKIIELWKLPTNYGFWVVVELILLSAFIFGINSSVTDSIGVWEKEKKYKRYLKEIGRENDYDVLRDS